MGTARRSQLGALEEMVQSHLMGLRETPLDLLDSQWFQAVTELLMTMHPEIAVWWRHRVRQALARHAVLHGCQAVDQFEHIMEEALRAWTATRS
ncbi:MAG: hypothetical protein HOP32_03675 [Nitrospira sp.]|nr:hypothetical protein [Nitrospira sp.]